MPITWRWRRWETSLAARSLSERRTGWRAPRRGRRSRRQASRWECRMRNCCLMAQQGSKCMSSEIFSEEQKQYLQGFITGSALRSGKQATFAATLGVAPQPRSGEDLPAGPERIHFEAQDRFTAAGKELVKEEQA